MSDEEEYEVDYILRARAEHEKPKARKKKLIWKYRVRWKNYTEEDDTWEPTESFKGSEELIENFWARCKRMLEGRDPHDLSQFQFQDEIFPTGPPIRPKRKIAPPADSPPASKRRQTSPPAPCPPDPPISSSPPVPCPPDPPISSSSSAPTVPSHQARAANPRVKIVDDPQLTELANAIPAKARVSSSRPRISGSRAGPGRNSQLELSTPRRSSLLTFDKGKKTLKGVKRTDKVQAEQRTDERHTPDDSTEIPGLSIPDAAAVLRLAGSDEKSAADLVDFRDDSGISPTLAYPEAAQARSSSQPPTTAGTGVVYVLRQSLAAAKETLFPSASSAIPQEQPRKWRISDANSTIFGALASGSGNSDESESPTAKFFLSFDSSAATPVRLLCASSDTPEVSSLTLDEIIKTQPKGPAGQFYRDEHAHNLLNTLRTIGPSAQVVLDETEANDDQRSHYERFQSKLQAGELFVEYVHEDLLAFCVPESSDIAQRLSFSKSLLAEAGHILVTRVLIKNDMGYYEAIENADKNRW